jgi:hypothetical protein
MPPPPNKSTTSNFYPAGQPSKLSPDPDFSIGQQHPIKSSERSGSRRGAKKSGTSSTSNTKSAKMRTPHAHDVLCGRGGSINSHKGNITFRNWVRERKEEYNLAANKNEKAKISKDIVDKVKSLVPPGRFLMKNESPSSGDRGLWVEIDDTKAMAKTSQALREGAPSLRAQAKAKCITPTPAKSSQSTRTTKSKRKYSGGEDDEEVVDIEKNDEHRLDYFDGSLSYDVDELTEDLIHPIITSMSDGHRGKHLIIPGSFEEIEYLQEHDHHQEHEQVQAVNHVPSTPPYKKQRIEAVNHPKVSQSILHPSTSNHYSTTRDEQYPTSSKTSTPVLVDYHEKISLPSGSSSIPFGAFSLDQNFPPPPPRYNNNNNNNRHNKNGSSNNNNSGINFIRAHSLALSDTFEDGFDPTAKVVNPFENDESTRGSSVTSFSDSIPHGNGNTRHEMNKRNQMPHQESTTSLDNMMKSKGFKMIGSSSFNSNHRNNVNNSDERRWDASSSSGRSNLSDLSDINYLGSINNNTVEFDEGMKDVYDAVYPGLYTPRGTDTAPTHLIPYSTFTATSIPSESSLSSRINNNRWSAFRRLPREKPYSRSGSYSSQAVNSSRYYQ